MMADGGGGEQGSPSQNAVWRAALKYPCRLSLYCQTPPGPLPMKPLPLLAAALLLPLTLPAAADDWQLVLSDRDRRIEIDRGTIIDSDRGTKVAWGRIVLSLEESRTAGYTTIKALNRYDCMNRSFLTVKRVFMDSLDRVIREEAAADQEPVAIARNSVDERMWREVCRPPTVSELDKVAQQAARAAAPAAPAKAEVKPPPKRATVQQAPRRAETTPSGARALENAQVGRPAPVRSAQFQPNAQEAQPAAATEGSGEAATPMPRQPQPAGSRSAPAASNATPAPIPTPAKSPSPTPPPARPQAAAPAASSAPHATAQHRPAAATHAAAPASAHAAAAAPAQPARPMPVLMAGEGWRYDGESGPDNWGKLRPDWRLCAEGLRQSPIDLRDGVAVDLEPVKFDYRPTRFRIADTGNTLRVTVGEGMGIELRGQRYALDSFTIHRPSEVRIGGQASDMSVQFLHRDFDGRIAIVSVLLERGTQPNPLLQAVLNNLPLEKGSNYMPTGMMDLGAFLPTSPAHYLYLGSLSTPPCTEGVSWVVLKQPVPVSDEQIAIFSRLYPRNIRPLQPGNGRLLLESR